MENELGLGKVSKQVFKRSVLPFISIEDIGLDGTIIKLTEKTVIAHSPSIGVPPEPLGFFAFHYAASNVACKFGRPTHLITGIYLPLKTKESDLKLITKTLGDEAKKFNVKIVAGQTATYAGLEIPFISTTCLGELIKEPLKPQIGDLVLLIGEIGKEILWLKKIFDGEKDETWKELSALSLILNLQNIDGMKLMHDVSEGGVKRALLEIIQNTSLSLTFNSNIIKYAKNADELPDILSAPTYSVLIAIIKPDIFENVQKTCLDNSFPCIILGKLTKGTDLIIDGKKVYDQDRILLDEIYGKFK
ncbi:hypothetical protein JW865_03245 [Candidatus Bathyarchaeota archaeon]|nr:hypothetical protein [Candidatus Bathyarchaeota archaeon]